MATIEVRVQVTIDGNKVSGFDPYIYRGEFDEATSIKYEVAAAGNAALAPSVINSREVTIVRADQDITCEFNQSGGLPGKVNVASNGIMIALGLQSVASSLLATIVANPGASDAVVQAVVAGDA